MNSAQELSVFVGDDSDHRDERKHLLEKAKAPSHYNFRKVTAAIIAVITTFPGIIAMFLL